MKQILITGANRGIGLELTSQLLARGDQVIAACRQPAQAEALKTLTAAFPDRLIVLPLDVTDDGSVAAAKTAVQTQVAHLDILINNAGILERQESLATFDTAVMQRTFAVNTIGAMHVISQFVGLLRAGRSPKLINMSSQLGSLQKMRRNWGTYSYNSSKAALNMLTRMLSFDLQADGITVVAIHPGWVQTDMGGSAAAVSVPDSVRGILNLILGLTLTDTGSFYTYAGDIHPW